MSAQWFYVQDETKQGPLSFEELLRGLLSHEYAGAVLVWRPGMTSWTAAAQVPELADQFPPPIPSPPIVAPSATTSVKPASYPAHGTGPSSRLKPSEWTGPIPMTTAPIQRSSLAATQAAWFLVSPLKLVIMTFVTFGLYEVFWFWKHWQALKQRTREKVRPFWRGLFAFFYCHALFKKLEREAVSSRIKVTWTPGGLTAAFILLSILWRLPDPFWLVTFLSVWPLTSAQQTANDVCRAKTPRADPNTSFSATNWVGIFIGGLLLILVIVVTFLPQPS